MYRETDVNRWINNYVQRDKHIQTFIGGYTIKQVQRYKHVQMDRQSGTERET